MVVEETPLEGCYVLNPSVFEDKRGYFFESFNKRKFEEVIGHTIDFVQDNQSYSTKGVLRGLHFQKGEFAQAKLVSVLFGNVLDVAVDLRKDSKTYGEHFSLELSSDNKKQLFIPRGFAHGFLVLSDSAHFYYKCDNYYNKEAEGGIIYTDSYLKINWGQSDAIVSGKDLKLPSFENFLKNSSF